jgi:toxin ParE1/3/4
MDSLATADRRIDRIIERCRLSESHPQLGPARPEIAPDARRLVEWDSFSTALYRARRQDAEVVCIAHGARRLAGLFHAES